MLSQGYGVTGTLDRWGQVDPVLSADRHSGES